MTKATLAMIICLLVCVGAWSTNYVIGLDQGERMQRVEWRLTGIELREVRPILAFEATWTDKAGLQHKVTVTPAVGQSRESAIAELAADVEAYLSAFPKD